MNQSGNFVFIKRSKLLSLALVGSLFYKLELILYKNGIINTIFLSLRNNPYKDAIFKTVSAKADFIVCQTYHFIRFFKGTKSKIVADFIPPATLKKQPKKVLQDVAWALIRSDYITQNSLVSFKDFVPKSFPVFEKYLPEQISLFNFFKSFLGRNKIEIIVWDFDGTLFFSPESAKKIKELFTKILSLKKNLPVKEAGNLLSEEQINSSWSSIVASLTGFKEKKVLTLLESKIDRTKYAKKDRRLTETFEKLKNYRHIILTNSTYKNTINTLMVLGFKPLNGYSAYPFERIFSLDDTNVPKPDRRAFENILEYTKLPREKHLMVGDSENTDILPAKALKFKTCKVGYKSPVSDFNSETVYDIPGILNNN